MFKDMKIYEIETGFYGVYLEKWEDCFYLYSENGLEEFIKNRPTAEELEDFANKAMRESHY